MAAMSTGTSFSTAFATTTGATPPSPPRPRPPRPPPPPPPPGPAAEVFPLQADAAIAAANKRANVACLSTLGSQQSPHRQILPVQYNRIRARWAAYLRVKTSFDVSFRKPYVCGT